MFWSEIKALSLIWQVLSFRFKKQTSKNVADTTFKATCKNIVPHFRAAFMDFSIILITLQEEFPPVKYHLCWICTSNKNKALKTKKFWISCLWLVSRPPIFGCFFWKIYTGASFEIIFMHKLFLDFLIVFHNGLEESRELRTLTTWVLGK